MSTFATSSDAPCRGGAAGRKRVLPLTSWKLGGSYRGSAALEGLDAHLLIASPPRSDEASGRSMLIADAGDRWSDRQVATQS